jgi:hypothetical protein
VSLGFAGNLINTATISPLSSPPVSATDVTIVPTPGPFPVPPVPGLSNLGLAAFALLLSVLGLARLRRKVRAE